MASGQDAALRKQQGTLNPCFSRDVIDAMPELQSQYTNYKTTLQSLAQKVGEIEQEIEEHRSVCHGPAFGEMTARSIYACFWVFAD